MQEGALREFKAMIQLVKPRVIIVSSGDYPANQRPRASLKDRLARTRIPVFYTGEDGAITIDLLPQNLLVKGTTMGARFLELSGRNRSPDNNNSP